ncbi:MarR family transcriptional regulator [Streptococcus anginosus]|uniref:MarR family transcriptional regulator n=1 Tax=Streptococcus anginosus TaxID=1328 RepID=UPI0022E40E91|nr:MarR family transcriptional regulator [Streptococcus anginosus]
MDRKIINSGFYIGKIHRLSNRLMNHILLERGIQAFNGEQGRILHALWQKNYQSQTELSEQTGLTLNTLTKMIDRMISMNLVERCSYEEDKRKKMVCLTGYAKGLQDEYNAISKEIIEIFYSGFSDLEIDEFETYLERIVANLTKPRKDKA